jgi:hypothetical protein
MLGLAMLPGVVFEGELFWVQQ